MKVLFCPAHYVYDDSREGSELSWAYNIADRVSRRFPASVVVTGKSAVGGRTYRIVEVTPQETRVNFGLINAFIFNARYTLAALRALRDSRFDLIHHVLPFSVGRTYNLAALRHGRATPFVIGPVQPPLPVRDADRDPADLKSHAFRRQTRLTAARTAVGHAGRVFLSDGVAPLVFGRLSRKTMADAAAIVAVNDETKEHLVHLGVSPARLAVIPPGVDTTRFRPAVVRRKCPRTKVLSVCQLTKRKNVDLIIGAFAIASRAAPQMELRIVGDGPEEGRLRRLANDLGVGANVSFAGFVRHAEVHREYERADVFVNASAAEGFATTCLEALAAGLPIISSRVGGFATAVLPNWNGYLVDGSSPAELAEALTRLVESPAAIDTMGARGRALAVNKFDWETAIIPKYLAVYEGVIGEREAALSEGGS